MKRVWNLCLLLLVVGLGSSCKDDLPGLGKDANRYFSGDDLVLTYSGEPMVGKEVHFLTYDGEKATITLDGLLDSNTLFPSEELHDIAFGAPGVVPGEVPTTLSNVPLTLNAEGTAYTFEGTDNQNNRQLTYKGEVSKDKMTLAIQVKMPANNFVGTWNVAAENALSMTWESDKTITVGGQELSTTVVGAMASTLLSPMLNEVLQSVTFMDDGNIVASYKKKGASDWQTSPINLAHFYVKDDKIYVQLHINQILSTRASVSEIVTLLTDMQMYLMEGIPMTYSLTADAVQISLTTDAAKSILTLLTSDFLRDKVVGILPDDISPIVQPILEQMPEVLKSTSKLEIQLSLKK